MIEDNVYLHGYVDRLDIAPTGEVRIVDYKTGKAPEAGLGRKGPISTARMRSFVLEKQWHSSTFIAVNVFR